MITFPFVVNAHTGSHRESNEKVWQLENSKTSFSAKQRWCCFVLIFPL